MSCKNLTLDCSSYYDLSECLFPSCGMLPPLQKERKIYVGKRYNVVVPRTSLGKKILELQDLINKISGMASYYAESEEGMLYSLTKLIIRTLVKILKFILLLLKGVIVALKATVKLIVKYLIASCKMIVGAYNNVENKESLVDHVIKAAGELMPAMMQFIVVFCTVWYNNSFKKGAKFAVKFTEAVTKLIYGVAKEAAGGLLKYVRETRKEVDPSKTDSSWKKFEKNVVDLNEDAQSAYALSTNMVYGTSWIMAIASFICSFLPGVDVSFLVALKHLVANEAFFMFAAYSVLLCAAVMWNYLSYYSCLDVHCPKDTETLSYKICSDQCWAMGISPVKYLPLPDELFGVPIIKNIPYLDTIKKVYDRIHDLSDGIPLELEELNPFTGQIPAIVSTIIEYRSKVNEIVNVANLS